MKALTILTMFIVASVSLTAQQHCDDVSVSVSTSTNIDFSFDTFGKYQAGVTQNGATNVKVSVSNDINNDPDCRWNLVLYVENASATTANTDWEELQSQSTSGAIPKIEMLQIRVRNNCNTSLTGNQFFNVPMISGTPIVLISNNGITTAAGSCITNVNGPGNAQTNYNEYNFDIDYRIVPTAGMRSGTYQLKIKYLLAEEI